MMQAERGSAHRDVATLTGRRTVYTLMTADLREQRTVALDVNLAG